MFLYYANEESDDIIGGSTKTAQHSTRLSSTDTRLMSTEYLVLPQCGFVHASRKLMRS